MTFRTTFVAGLAVCALLSPVSARAQSREQLQMMADMRQLQDQLAKTQLAVNQLADQVLQELKTLNKKLEDQSTASANSLASVQARMADDSSTITAISQKVDAQSTRIQQLAADLASTRTTMEKATQTLNTLTSIVQPPANLDAAAASGANAPATPGALGTVKVEEAPSKLYDQADTDYMGSRYDNAIAGFNEYLQKYPDGPQAGDAAFYMGMSLFGQRKWQEALKAFGRVVSDYKNSDLAPDALYQEGLTYQNLGRTTEARNTFNSLLKQYPTSSAALQARQALDRMSTGGH